MTSNPPGFCAPGTPAASAAAAAPSGVTFGPTRTPVAGVAAGGPEEAGSEVGGPEVAGVVAGASPGCTMLAPTWGPPPAGAPPPLSAPGTFSNVNVPPSAAGAAASPLATA